MKLVLIILLCCFSAVHATAQQPQPVAINITPQDGLPGKSYFGLVEDSKGYIWLAGNNGLTRYDGKNFKTYTHPDKRGLSVFEVAVDSNDRVWCVNISGQVLYVEDDIMHIYTDMQEVLNGQLARFRVTDSHLSVSTIYNTRIYNLRDDTYKDYEVADSNVNFYLTPWIEHGEIGRLEDYELIKTNGSKTSLPKVTLDTFFNKFLELHTQSRSIFYDDAILDLEQNQLNQKTLIRITDGSINEIQLPPILNDRQIGVFKEVNEELWLLTDKGIFITIIKDNRLIVKDYILSNYFITGIVTDRDNNYWATTLRNGLLILPNRAINSIKLLAPGEKIMSMAAGLQDNLLIGTTQGRIINYNTVDKNIQVIQLALKKDIDAIMVDPYNKRYTFFQPVENFTYDISLERKVSSNTYLNSVKNAIAVSPDSIVFTSSFFNGKTPFPPKGEFLLNNEKDDFIIRKRGFNTAYDTVNQLAYYGTIDGIQTKHKNTDYQLVDVGHDRVYTDQIVAQNDTVWTATMAHGLYMLKNGKVLKQWDVQTENTDNHVYSVCPSEKNIWVATAAGLQRINKQTGNIKTLAIRDGLPFTEIENMAIIDGVLYCTGLEGLFTINTSKAFREFDPLDIYFTDVTIDNQKQPIQNSYAIEQDNSAVEISFHANGYRSTTSGLYEYRVKGIDDSWSTIASGINTIRYANLSRGDLTFQIRAINDKNTLKEIELEVYKVFYKTFWFWLVLGLLLLATAFYFYRRKLQRTTLKKNAQLEQLRKDKEFVNLRLENLRSQMNPHFVFNALNSIQDYIVRNHKNLASDYLGKFADLIRTYLEHSVKSEIPLEEEIATLKMYLDLEKLRFEDKLHYTINVDCDSDTSLITIPTMLIQPYVENALKHGLLHKKTDRRLTIAFQLCSTTDNVICTVTDNGIGRKKATQINERNILKRKSFATQATQNRLELLNQKMTRNIGVEIIDLEDNQIESGTKVIITIPAKKLT